MNTYKILVAFTLIVVTLNACGTTPTPPSSTPPPTEDTTIGIVNTMQDLVQAGPIGKLSDVPVSQALYSNDAVHVMDGGVALLNFFDQIALKLFNDTSVGGVNVEISESTNKRVRMKLERGGLSGQVAKESGGVDFEIANGFHIYILGTQFYVTYDPATDVVSAGNFDGTVGYQVPGQSLQMLPAGSLLDVLPGGTVQISNMPFDAKAFDTAAQRDNSPIQGLKDLRQTFTISGNAGVAGATLSYTDGTTKIATADAYGNYSFTVSYNWSGTVTPFKTEYTFSPTDKSYTNVLSDQTAQNYIATVITYIISGNAGVGGATLSYTDGVTKTATADESGNYSFTVSYKWSGTVTPSKMCYSFSPTYRSYTNVPADQTAQNYSVTPTTYTISGNAGTGYATLSYTDGAAKIATADAYGNYSFTVSCNWSGIVTPSKADYAFTPPNKSYTNVTTNQATQTYTANHIPYVISGNAGTAYVTLSYTDGITKTTTTDGCGNYSFTVSYGWSGTVTPSKTGYTFIPTYRSYTNIVANQTAQNYSVYPPYVISGFVNRTSEGGGLVGVTITYTGSTSGETTTSWDGDYLFTVPYCWSGTVTPSKAGYTFKPSNRSYTNVTANQTVQNYTVVWVTISGRVVKESNGTEVAGVTITYTGSTSGTTTTDSNGYYSFTVPYDWSGTVTPSYGNGNFNPWHREYTNITTNQSAQDYIIWWET